MQLNFFKSSIFSTFYLSLIIMAKQMDMIVPKLV